MDNLLEKLRVWGKKIDPPIAVMVVGFLLMLWGHNINVTRQQRVEAELAAATVLLQQAEIVVNSSQEEYNDELDWFRSSYLVPARDLLTEARNLLGNKEESGARFDLAQARAKNNWSESVSLAQQSQIKADQAILASQEVSKFILNLKQQRQNARIVLANAKSSLASHADAFKSASARLDEEEVLYLNTYMHDLRSHQEVGQARWLGAEEKITSATALLPPNSNQEAIGDPTLALKELDVAAALILALATETQRVTAGLDYQAEAKAQAETTILLVVDQKALLEESLRELYVSRGYTKTLALKEAYLILDTRVTPQLTAAQRLLATVTEEKLIDHPAAYEMARQASQSVTATNVSATNQVLMHDSALSLLAQYPAKLSQLDTLMVRAQTSRNTLSSNHIGSSWSEVAEYIVLAQEQRTQAGLAITAANVNIELGVQRFDLGQTDAQNALAHLGRASALVQALMDRSSALESVRAQWPSQQEIAQQAISSADAKITSLNRSYNMSVPSNTLATARKQLGDAQVLSSQKSWEAAISQVQVSNQTALMAHSQANAQKDAEDAQATAVAVEKTRVSVQKTANANATIEAAAAATRQQANANAAATSTARMLESMSDDNNSSGSTWSSGSSGSSSSSSSSGSSSGSWNSGGNDNGAWNSGANDNNAWDD